MAFTLEFLSASVSGKPIRITNTGSPGNPIHTGVAGTSQKDEIFMYANNTGTSPYLLYIEHGGTELASRLVYTIPPQSGLVLVSPSLPIYNSAVIRAFSNNVSSISIVGYVQRGP